MNHKKEDHVGFRKWPLTCEGHWPWSKEDCMEKEQGSDVLGAEREVERKQPEREMLGLRGSSQTCRLCPDRGVVSGLQKHRRAAFQIL